MITKAISVGLASGLEARPVAMLVQIASAFESVIHVETKGRTVNAKSIMGMMTLGLAAGEKLTVAADGPDEAEAMSEIERYLSGRN